MVADGVAALTEAFIDEIPNHTSWRTFTVSACAFPPGMGGIARNSGTLIERPDWLSWRDGCYAQRGTLARLPTFGDGAIQHPKGVEGFNPKTMQASAAVRYISSDGWLLIKGESTRTTRPGLQFPILAKRLVYGDLSAFYAGAAHCEGCASARAAADGAPGFGSPEMWRRIGTIHHITTVVEQIRALTWP